MFLGLASYYFLFVLGFTNTARPLNEKTSYKVKFFRTEDMQIAFEELKVQQPRQWLFHISTMKNHSLDAPMYQAKQLVILYPSLTKMVEINR